jgi:predicted transcriptional regulator
MKYYSDKLDKKFETVEELETAEKDYDAKETEKKALAETRKAESKEVVDAFKKFQGIKQDSLKELNKKIAELKDTYTSEVEKAKEEYMSKIGDAETDYSTKLNEFIKKYGSFHYSYTSDNLDESDNSIIKELFDSFNFADILDIFNLF